MATTPRILFSKGEGNCYEEMKRTTCDRGHPYAEGTYYVNVYGDRVCRACATIRSLKSYYKRKQLKTAA